MTQAHSTGIVGRVLVGLGSVALAVMTLWTVVDVLARNAFSHPLTGTLDLVEATLVLVVFLALPAVFERDEQITVDVLDHVLGDRVIAWLKLFASLVVLVFLGVLGYTGLAPLADAWGFGDRKPDLPIPIYALLAAIELAIAVSLVVIAAKVVRGVRSVFHRGAR